MSFPKTIFWQRYKPDAKWDLRRVVHLHRRAGFAANWSEIQRDLKDGFSVSVDRLLHANSSSNTGSDELTQTIGDAAMLSGNASRLKAWWLLRMLKSADPLGERLTLMWHNHFATSNRKVQDLRFMREQNELFRHHARAPFADLLTAVVKHPAMLSWLDADSNRKSHPNENLGRELLELFTLGVGNYSESDVKNAARALTGWTIVDDKFGFREKRHDDTAKKILGTSAEFTGDDLLKLLLKQPATARRIAWRLCRTFMGEGVVSDDAIDELATGLADNELNIGWAVETILRSGVFYSEANIRSHVLGPVEYLVGVIRNLELCDSPPSTLVLAEWVSRMGQDLFYPPNVGGWNEGRSWLATRTVIARANFAHALAAGKLWHPLQKPDVDSLFKQYETGDQTITQWLANLFWGDAPKSVIDKIKSNENTANGENHSVVSQLLTRPEHHLA